MLSKELLEEVNALSDDDKLTLLHTLMDNLALGSQGYELFAYRGNYQVAEALMKELEKLEATTPAEID